MFNFHMRHRVILLLALSFGAAVSLDLPATASAGPLTPPSGANYWCSPQDASCNQGQRIVDAAKNQIGVAYRLGAGDINGPTGSPPAFDCTGLAIYAVYQATGKALPKDRYGIEDWKKYGGQLVEYNSGSANNPTIIPEPGMGGLKPGDLLLYGGPGDITTSPDFYHDFHHLAIYVSSGVVVNALNSQAGVIKLAPTNGDLTKLFYEDDGSLMKYQGAIRYWQPTCAMGCASTYYPITPERILDSRSGIGLSGVLKHNVPRWLQVGGVNGIPADATAVTGNLTVTGQTAAGYLYIGPESRANPTTSTLNFPVGDNRANGVTVQLGPNAVLYLTYFAATGSTNAIFDVTGYFRSNSGGDTYYPITPERIYDSRNCTGLFSCMLGALTPHAPLALQVGGVNGIPADATAVTGNLTVTDQTAAGYLYIGPDSLANPTTSTLNFPVGDIRANGVTVKLGTNAELYITYVGATGSTNVIFDITGYFRHVTSGDAYHPITPKRILDSRVGTGGLSGVFIPHVPRWLQVGGGGYGIPADATAVTGNLTVTGQTAAGYLYLGPESLPNPNTSTLNFPVGDNRANGVTVQLGPSAVLYITYVGATGSTNVIFDVTGYFD